MQKGEVLRVSEVVAKGTLQGNDGLGVVLVAMRNPSAIEIMSATGWLSVSRLTAIAMLGTCCKSTLIPTPARP